jgi:hypothetical protein
MLYANLRLQIKNLGLLRPAAWDRSLNARALLNALQYDVVATKSFTYLSHCDTVAFLAFAVTLGRNWGPHDAARCSSEPLRSTIKR